MDCPCIFHCKFSSSSIGIIASTNNFRCAQINNTQLKFIPKKGSIFQPQRKNLSFSSFGKMGSLLWILVALKMTTSAVETRCRDLEDLRLSCNQFNGNIPSEIGSLVNLKILDLGQNSFEGGIPKQLGNLTSLNTLYLGENKLTGELPRELSNLAYLEKFSIGHNALSGSIPSFMFNISKTLKIMSFSSNQFSGSLPSTIGMGILFLNLENLSLSGNRLSGPIPSYITNNASKLTHLGMRMNSFSGCHAPGL